jgi:mono/diheme cytochrome c family protein
MRRERGCTKDREATLFCGARPCHSSRLAGSVDDFGDSSSPWRSVQSGEEMLRTWVIAGIALAASTGPTLGQDAAAGEQVFKRLCSPCHEIGSMAARAAPSTVSPTPQPINLAASRGARKLSPNISARRCKKSRAPAWHLSAARTTRTSQTAGALSRDARSHLLVGGTIDVRAGASVPVPSGRA